MVYDMLVALTEVVAALTLCLRRDCHVGMALSVWLELSTRIPRGHDLGVLIKSQSKNIIEDPTQD